MFNVTGRGNRFSKNLQFKCGCTVLVFVEFIELRLLRGETQLNKMTTHTHARENEIKHKKKEKRNSYSKMSMTMGRALNELKELAYIPLASPPIADWQQPAKYKHDLHSLTFLASGIVTLFRSCTRHRPTTRRWQQQEHR